MNFTSIKEVEKALEPLMATALLTTGQGLTTERTFRLAGLVDSPQEQLRVVHVAGTSGKTSTAYYTARLLRAAGARVGLTVSPHITSITERVQINGRPLDEAVFCRYMSEFLPQVVRGEADLPSYFEVMMVFALWVFAREGVDYAVVETGLGGLHDSSNICRRGDKLCIITDIGIDHTHILGDTIEAIAAQKAGIIALGNHVIMHGQAPEIVGVITRQATLQSAALEVLPAADYANYQDRNFALSQAAYDYLAGQDGLPVVTDEQRAEVRRGEVPGRLQVRRQAHSMIILDGAHNEQKMYTLVRTLKEMYPGRKWAVVFAMKSNKDYAAVIPIIAPLAKRAIAVPLHTNQDMHNASVAPEVLAAEFTKYGVPCETADSVQMALDSLIEATESDILVTGSLYAIAEVY